MQSVPEDEFYRQASLSQLLTGPDEQELSSFRPDAKDPLELVEASPELAGMLGSSLEFVDSRWDSLETSPPPTPPPSARPLQRIPPPLPPLLQGTTGNAKVDLQNRTAESGQCQGLKNVGYSTAAATMETKLGASMWEPQQQGSKNAGIPATAKPNIAMNASLWELQNLRNKNTGIANSANPDSKMDLSMWEQQRQGSKSTGNTIKSDMAAGASMWEPQRLRSRNAMILNSVNSDADMSEPQRLRNKNTNAAISNGAVDANTWKRQSQGSKYGGEVSDSTDPGVVVDGGVWEPQRLRSKNSGISSTAKLDATVDANTWEHQAVKRAGGNSTAPKRDACDTQNQGGKTIKMDAAWQRNLGNVRVHIRDLGMKVGGGTIRSDMKKEPGKVAGKGARVKSRS